MKFTIQKDEYDLPDFAFIMSQYEKITKLMRDGVIRSAQAVDGNGVADAVAKMAFGNKIGAKFCKHKPKEYFFTPGYGEIVAEIAEEDLSALDVAGVVYDKIGKTLDNPQFECDDEVISMEEALSAWSGTLEKVFLPVPVWKTKKSRPDFTIRKTFMYANIKWQNLPYLFRYSQEQTVSMIPLFRSRQQVLIQRALYLKI